MIKPATHSGSWYSADPSILKKQLSGWFSMAAQSQSGSRVLVGPHAGYTYCGARLAETYSVWDLSKTKRVFILGPSHHAYFKDKVLLSLYEAYETPFGNVPVDTEICNQLKLLKDSPFQTMSESVDDEEHLFEMHMPFLVYRCQQDSAPLPKIIPILVSSLSTLCRQRVVDALSTYMDDPQNAFVVLSDFCHWGRRFGYTAYVPNNDLGEQVQYSQAERNGVPIYKSIEYLDRSAMMLASAGSAAEWDSYIETTGNTICGQKPIGILLRLIERYKKNGGLTVTDLVFEWLGYSQSSKAVEPSDSSVSYASGHVRLN
ncbi:UPF0103-domain-containing protein [Metschnikowia bicuspidata]|uniref:UPF0103-domain-containing protein n=1 Tax=Metschnikowia bicuspidata TaxID=27322 RepID=A0A4P9Z9Q8_9ASCO|nr:UPF0103-domain-containing protein [Metschnikowia bicuspidata]